MRFKKVSYIKEMCITLTTKSWLWNGTF